MSTDSVFDPSTDQKPVEIVYNEDRIKILIDDTRKAILNVLALSKSDMCVTEIATSLRTTPQRIYHHVDKLVEYNFLTKTREVRKKRSITSYYARTAKAFVVSYSTDRGYIHNDALIEHFLNSFRSILGLELESDDAEMLGDYIKELASISEQIFTTYSNQKDTDIQKHAIENLYFLLEYLIFYTHSEARVLIDKINDFIIPKLLSTNSSGIKTMRI